MPLVALIALTAPALAAPPEGARSAKDEFDLGNRYFDVQEYDAAMPHFRAAYELSGKRGSTIFALAQCERALELYDDAITHFREYLEGPPRPPDAKAVANTIVLLEEKRDSLRAERAPAVPPEPASVASASVSAPPPAWVAEAPPPAEASEDEGGWGATVLWIVAGAAVAAGGAVALGFALGGGETLDRGTTGVLLER